MKLLFVTDVHESRTAVGWLARARRQYDALIVGGDVSSWGREEYLEEFFSGIGPGRAVFVEGNHDPRTSTEWPGVSKIHGRKTELEGLVFGGIGGSSPTRFGTPFELDDGEASRLLGMMGHVDVLVSHCPPFGTKCDVTSSGEHIGSRPVRKYIEAEGPRLVLTGHVHEARGTDNLGSTRLVNPGPFFEGNYAILDSSLNVQLMKENLAE